MAEWAAEVRSRTGLRTINTGSLRGCVLTRPTEKVLCLSKGGLLAQPSKQQRPDGLQNKAKVPKWRPVEYVLQIESCFVFGRMLLPKSVDLSEARHTASNFQSLPLPF